MHVQEDPRAADSQWEERKENDKNGLRDLIVDQVEDQNDENTGESEGCARVSGREAVTVSSCESVDWARAVDRVFDDPVTAICEERDGCGKNGIREFAAQGKDDDQGGGCNDNDLWIAELSDGSGDLDPGWIVAMKKTADSGVEGGDHWRFGRDERGPDNEKEKDDNPGDESSAGNNPIS